MSENRELYHDGAKCPECGERVGVPDPDMLVRYEPQFPSTIAVGEMQCASCGHDWEEANVREIARAWFAHGAYERHQVEERRNHAVTELLAPIEAKTVAGIVAWLRGRLATYKNDAIMAQAKYDRPLLSRSVGALAALDRVVALLESGEWKEKTDDER